MVGDRLCVTCHSVIACTTSELLCEKLLIALGCCTAATTHGCSHLIVKVSVEDRVCISLDLGQD